MNIYLKLKSKSKEEKVVPSTLIKSIDPRTGTKCAAMHVLLGILPYTDNA